LNQLIAKAAAVLEQNHACPLQVRIFRMICLVTGILCLLVILPTNCLQNLPVWVNVGDGVAGLLGCLFLWRSWRGRHHFLAYYLAIVVILDVVWFFNGGSSGSVTYYFPALALYPMAVFRAGKRRALLSLLVLNVGGLLLAEYWVPSLTTPFARPADRYLDLFTGAVCAGAAAVAIVWVLLRAYDSEQRQLRQSLDECKRLAVEKEAALVEMREAGRKLRALEGTLQTVCAWTRKIKDGDDWIDLERYIERHLKIRLSHGMSPEAYQRQSAHVFGARPNVPPRKTGENPAGPPR
jgi:hypothetical protein